MSNDHGKYEVNTFQSNHVIIVIIVFLVTLSKQLNCVKYDAVI